jgi:hypothetical protein
MKRCKWLWSVLVVIVALSMSLSPASAQQELPSNGAGIDELVGVDLSAPLPLSPINSARVYTKTPKFLFTKHPEATNYRVIVYKLADSVPLYTYSGPFTCVDSICKMIPDFALKNFQYIGKGGAYKWQVEAYIGDYWSNTSPYANFYVLSKGFTSTFDLDTKKWMPVNNDWKRTSKGYYKTEGAAGVVTSAMQLEYFEDHIVYEVRLKRKVETEPNFIMINGNPDPLHPNGTWGYADVLEYSNSGTWRILRSVGGSVDQLSAGASAYIVPFGWNTWTIWADYPNIYVWVNGVFVTVVTETNPYMGYVGVGMYRSGSESSPLLVDYAKVYYSGIFPMKVPEGANAGLQ